MQKKVQQNVIFSFCLSLFFSPKHGKTNLLSASPYRLIILSASKVILLSNRLTQQSYIIIISNMTSIINLHILKSNMQQKLTKTHTA